MLNFNQADNDFWTRRLLILLNNFLSSIEVMRLE
jgi:hypothetical protein